MNSKTVILFFIALSLAGSTVAQTRKPLSLEEVKQRLRLASYSGGGTLPPFVGENYYRTDEAEPIDTARLLITYDLAVQRDTLLLHDRVAAEVGDRYTKFYSLYLLEVSKNHEDRQRKSEAWVKGCNQLFPQIVLFDKAERRIENRICFPYSDNRFYRYDEPAPEIAWQLSEETAEVAGYLCRQANCRFRGREWRVWYAPELPSPIGFWKLHGLPGMILAAEDSTGTYRFTTIGIERANAPIVLHQVPTQILPRERIRKAEARIYAHPVDAMRESTGQNYLVIITGGRAELVTPSDPVLLWYDPLELE